MDYQMRMPYIYRLYICIVSHKLQQPVLHLQVLQYFGVYHITLLAKILITYLRHMFSHACITILWTRDKVYWILACTES